MPRDDFTKPVQEALARRVGFRCSNPRCRAATVGPAPSEDRFSNNGVAAHITAASVGGPRYDATISREARRSIANGIWPFRTPPLGRQNSSILTGGSTVEAALGPCTVWSHVRHVHVVYPLPS